MQLKWTIGLAAAGWIALSGVGRADEPLGVVELFTSQGCKSCPKADAVFNDLVAKGDVIALAYHVDYWDYLGWQDTLARPQNTERQYAYMKSLGSRAVYTPQMIVNGRNHVNGTNRAGVEDDLTEQARDGQGLTVDMKVSESEDSITIQAGATDQPSAEANLVLVFFNPPQPIAISRGENSGRTVTYQNSVTDVRTAGVWHGKVTQYELPKSEFDGKGSVALLQISGKDGSPGPILGAALIKQPSDAAAQ